MARVLAAPSRVVDRDHRFFLGGAIVMVFTIVAGFSMQLAAGRSSFAVPLFLHVHAFIFFGWTALYLLQNALVATGSVHLHRRLGWLASIWVPAMVAMGVFVTVASARTGHVPFFFRPAYFVAMNILGIAAFAALVAAALAMRRRRAWHKRLMFCAMASILGPGVGRIIPMPLLMPYSGEVMVAVIALFPLAGMIHDRRMHGRVHPAWFWGLGAILATEVAINALTFSPLGPALYRAVTVGSVGIQAAPLDFPPPPWLSANAPPLPPA